MKAPVVLSVLLLAGAFAGCAAPAGERLSHGSGPSASPAPAASGWPPLSVATIRPGTLIHTEKRDCESDFVFTRPDNTSVFLGTTANCMRDVPLGGLVTLGGPLRIGILVYSSWQTMQEVGEKDADALNYNDFAVIRVDESTRPFVNPALLERGGPVGLAGAADLAPGARLESYQNGTLAGVDRRLSWNEGLVTGAAGDWALLVHAAPPALPGDMGGAVVTPDGKAVGVVVTLGVTPLPGAQGVMRLDTAMKYAREHAKLDMHLSTWDVLQPGLV